MSYKESLSKIYNRYKKRKIYYSIQSSTSLKISSTNNNGFSLPAGKDWACPKATKACKACYAQKGRFVFDNVKSVMIRNWMVVKHAQKHKATDSLVKQLLEVIPIHAKVYRLHISGDFISNWYIGVWAKVITARPNTHFWTYTRSFDFDFKPLVKLPNFVLWASSDSYNGKSATAFVNKYKKYGVKKAFGPWDINKIKPKNSFYCPVTIKRMAPEGACEKCLLCVIKDRVNKNVIFPEH